MAKQKRRPANDRAFKKYTAQNQRYKNKIRKVERHIARHPNDEQAKNELDRLLKNGYNSTKGRAKKRNSIKDSSFSVDLITTRKDYTVSLPFGEQIAHIYGKTYRPRKVSNRRKRSVLQR